MKTMLIDVCETDSIELRGKKLLFVGSFTMSLNYLKVKIFLNLDFLFYSLHFVDNA